MQIKKKKLIENILQISFLVLILINLIQCEEHYTEESMKIEDHGVAVGLGTLFVLLFSAIGIAICILGQATAMPGVFILIGILLPLLVFIICAFWPVESLGENKYKLPENNFIVARWFYFSVMLAFFLGLIGPLFCLFTVTLIPQRVDSRAQKESEEKYKKMLERQAEKDKFGQVKPKQNDQALNLSDGHGGQGGGPGYPGQGYGGEQGYPDQGYGQGGSQMPQQDMHNFPQTEDERNKQNLEGYVRRKKKK